MPASSYQQQKLRVCEVCSAYLGIHDNDRRLADHFGGKLHLGFINIREKLAELQVSVCVPIMGFVLKNGNQAAYRRPWYVFPFYMFSVYKCLLTFKRE